MMPFVLTMPINRIAREGDHVESVAGQPRCQQGAKAGGQEGRHDRETLALVESTSHAPQTFREQRHARAIRAP
jgi:hypothetical protein